MNKPRRVMTGHPFGGDNGRSARTPRDDRYVEKEWPEMMTDAEHAVRNQQMIVLVLGLATVKALVRNRIIVVVGLAGVAIVAQRKGAAASAVLRNWAAANKTAWHVAKPAA
jgi:hypothetical protein